MTTVFVDSGPIISLSLNCLLWVFEKAKKHNHIHFYITQDVKKEVVDNPLTTKKFKLEALRVQRLIDQGILEVVDDKTIADTAHHLLELANSAFRAHNKKLTLIHYAEMSAIAAYLHFKGDAVMIDERTTRYLIERPNKLRNIMRHRLHTPVDIDQRYLTKLRKRTSKVKFIRSVEFITVAFERGLLDGAFPGVKRSELLDALLWGLKLNGCAISERDLRTVERITR